MRMRTKSSNGTFDIRSGIEPLIHRLNSTFASGKGAILTFIAAHEGEGTSTVTQALAAGLYREVNKKVLLIENYLASPGLVDVANQDIEAAISETTEGYYRASWVSKEQDRVQSGRLIRSKKFVETIQSLFDVIIIDAPALNVSNEGIVYAQAATATVLIVEAEKTRKQVVDYLRDTLEAAGAKIAGAVLNKRKFYIPEEVYKRL